MGIVAIGILERAMLLDREHLLPCGERRVQFVGAQFHHP